MHIRSIHPYIKLESKRQSLITSIIVEIDSGNLNNKKCTICDRDYASRDSYRMHVYGLHKDGKREPAVRGNTRANEKDDSPNNYCQLCKKTYANKFTYIRHTKTTHSNK